MKIHTTYLITNVVNKKMYVGVTSATKETRWKFHVYESKAGINTVLNRAILHYGEEKFVVTEIEQKNTIEESHESEKKYIKEYKTFYIFGFGYNMTTGGDGVPNFFVTEELRNRFRMNAARKDSPLRTPEARRKNGLTRKGDKHYVHKFSLEKRREKILCMETPEAVAKRAGDNHYRRKPGWKLDEKVASKQAEKCRQLKIDRAAVRNECLALMKLYNVHLDLPSHGNSGSIDFWTKNIFKVQLLAANVIL